MARADGLKASQVKALEVLLRGGSTLEAAEAAGCDRRTCRRWKNEPGPFRDALEEHSAAALDDLRFKITLSLEKVIGEAEKIIDSPKTTLSVKVQAMGTILQIARSLDVLKGDGPQGETTPGLKEWLEKHKDMPT